MMMQPVYQYVPSPVTSGGIHSKMRNSKQAAQHAPIESRVMLRDGRTVNNMQQQNKPVPIE